LPFGRTSLIVTTNLPFESWTEVLGSARLTGATLDRLTHRCQIIEAKGEGYRLRYAQAKLRKGGAGDSGSRQPRSRAREGGKTSTRSRVPVTTLSTGRCSPLRPTLTEEQA
jgi:hypothetical protein